MWQSGALASLVLLALGGQTEAQQPGEQFPQVPVFPQAGQAPGAPETGNQFGVQYQPQQGGVQFPVQFPAQFPAQFQPAPQGGGQFPFQQGRPAFYPQVPIQRRPRVMPRGRPEIVANPNGPQPPDADQGAAVPAMPGLAGLAGLRDVVPNLPAEVDRAAPAAGAAMNANTNLPKIVRSIGNAMGVVRQTDGTVATPKGGARLSAAFPIETSAAYAFHVGTSARGSDVVKSDVTQRKWSDQSEMGELEMVKENGAFNTFFLSRDDYPVAADGSRSSLFVQRPFVYVEGRGIRAQVTEWPNEVMTRVPSVTNTTHSLEFTVQYTCDAEVSLKVLVKIRAFMFVNGGAAPSRSTKTFSFNYVKHCKSESEGEDKEGSALPKLNVATSREGVADVIQNGLSTPAFTVKRGETNDNLHETNAETLVERFFVKGPKGLVVGRPAVVVHNPAVLTVELSGTLPDRAGLDPVKEHLVGLKYDCLQKGDSLVTVHLPIPSEKMVRTIFTLKKICGDPAKSETPGAVGVPLAGLVVGSAEGADDVIKDGEAQPKWRPVRPEQEDGYERFVVDDKTSKIWFYVTLRDDKDGTPAVLTPVINEVAVSKFSKKPVVHATAVTDASWSEFSKATPTKFSVDFFCNEAGETNIIVSIPIRGDDGMMKFVFRKQCAGPKTETKVDVQGNKQEVKAVDKTEDKAQPDIPGFSVGTARGRSNVIKNGHTNPRFIDSEGGEEKLFTVDKNKRFITFFLGQDPDLLKTAKEIEEEAPEEGAENAAKPKAYSLADWQPVAFSEPELTIADEIATPSLSGSCSEGGMIRDNSAVCAIAVTFHCMKGEGSTVMTITIPVVHTDDNNPKRFLPKTNLRFSFVKECSDDVDGVHSGLNGVGMNGFSIGTKEDASDVVFNGFPQPLYQGVNVGKHVETKSVLVPETTRSTTFYLHLNSNVEVMELDNENALSDALKKIVRSMPSAENLLKVAVEKANAMADVVAFQAPMVTRADAKAKPVLSGSAVDGGMLLRDKEPLELTVTYNCRYKGYTTISIVVPIVPHGQIVFTVPKQCGGREEPAGEGIKGLIVGTTPGGSDVVNDGFTTEDFRPFNAEESGSYEVYKDATTFFITNSGEKLTGLEPILFAHRGICNPKLEHDLHVDTSNEEDDKDEEKKAVGIVIDDLSRTLNVTYNCVWRGETSITLTIPLLPKGRVSFSWTKVCGSNEPADASAAADGNKNGAGEAEGEKYDDYDDYYDAYADLYHRDSDYYGYDEYGDGEPENAAGEKDPASVASGEEGKIDQGEGDADKGSGEERGAYDDYYENPGIAVGVAAQDGFDAYKDSHAFNPDAYDDEELREFALHHAVATGYVNVGVTPFGNEVVEFGVATAAYGLPRLSEDDNSVHKGDKVIPRTQEFSEYYLSVDTKEQEFGPPVARAMRGKNGADIVFPELSGDATMGGTLQAGEPMKLKVAYSCVTNGVAGVLVSVPLVPKTLGSVNFRVLKVCGQYEKKEEFYWTAGKILSLFAFVMGAGIIFFAYKFITQNKGYEQLNKGQAAVPSAAKGGDVEQGGVQLGKLDHVDIDSESD